MLSKWFKQLPIFKRCVESIAKHEYAYPVFILRELMAGINRHNVMGLAAALSFYALLAIIPLLLLIFFLLSHLIYTSDYAIVQLAVLSSNLLPDLSKNIMIEVYNNTQTGAAWGVIGLFLLLWSVTPLASAMRNAFHTIAHMVRTHSFIKRKLGDIFSVLGVLLLFFVYSSAGFYLERVLSFLSNHISSQQAGIILFLSSLLITTLLIALFYRAFFPLRVSLSHLLTGALTTALLWLLIRPSFALFLSIHQDFGAIFGSMKAMFISIIWLYLNFAAFLVGTVMIATLSKQDSLLIKKLFDHIPDHQYFYQTLLKRYGKTYQVGDTIYLKNNLKGALYYLYTGEVSIFAEDKQHQTIQPGHYFGEVSCLTQLPTQYQATVTAPKTQIITIEAKHIQTILAENPEMAISLFKQLS